MKAGESMSAWMERIKRRADELAELREERRKGRRDRLNKMRLPAQDKGLEPEPDEGSAE